MIKNKYYLGLILAFFIGSNTSAKAQEGETMYYDSLYEEYYEAFPDQKPEPRSRKTNNTQQNQQAGNPNSYFQPTPYNPYVATQNNFNVEHDPKKFYLDISKQTGTASFGFEMNVGSILKWNELQTSETLITISKDFIRKGKNYVFKFETASGSATSDYTLDDDIWNELHIFSAGNGLGDLSTKKFSFGLRNYKEIAGYQFTPYFGYKMKYADLKMTDHGQPVPFFFTCLDGYDWDSDGYLDYCPLLNEIEGVTYYVPYGDLISDSHYETFDFFWDDGGTPTFDPDGNSLYIEGEEDLVYYFGNISSTNALGDVSHIYDVSWKGWFIAGELEKAISRHEIIRFYGELFIPEYDAIGDWPNRDSWAHPSFNDKGGSSIGYTLEGNYILNLSDKFQAYAGFSYERIETTNAATTVWYLDGFTETYPNEIKIALWEQYSYKLGIKGKF